MSKKLIVLIVVVVVVLVAVGIWIGVSLLRSNPAGASAYSAVYLTSGDVYFGKLGWFPWPHLKEVWYLQRTVNQQNQPQLGIVPFRTAFWGPVDEVYLNPRQVLFWAHLRNDSQVAKALASPAAFQQPAVSPQGVPQQTPPAPTSTSR